MLNVKLCAFADEASPNLSEQIVELNKNNVPYLEIRTVNGKSIFDATVEEAKEWKKELDEGGIKVWSVGSPIGKIAPAVNWSEYIEQVKNLFCVANALDCKNVRMFSFYTTEYEKDADFVVEKLTELCALAKEYGLTLYHENEKGIFGDLANRCEYLLDKVPALNSIFDPANYVQCKQDVKEALALMKGRIGYYHIKDAIWESGAVVPAGKGDGALPEVVDSIEKDTVLTLEPHLTIFAGYSHIDKTELKHEYTYPDSKTAFKASVDSIKEILIQKGYKEVDRTWIK